MSKLNEINLHRSYADIAGELALRGNQELRAKLVDGRTVLYSKKTSLASKVVGNLFHDRAKKRANARELVLKKFEFLPNREKGQVLCALRWTKPVASSYKGAFALAATFDLAFRQLEDAPKSLNDFLKWKHREDLLPALRKLAKENYVNDELAFVEDLDDLSGQSQPQAVDTAERLCRELLSESLNVHPDKLKALAKALEIPWDSRTRPPAKWIEKLHPMPSEVQRALLECRAELVKDMNHAIYLPLLGKKINAPDFKW